MQRQYGHQAIAYLVLFTGRVDASLLDKVHATNVNEEKEDDELAEKRHHQFALRQKVHTARENRRWAAYLDKRLQKGTLKEEA